MHLTRFLRQLQYSRSLSAPLCFIYFWLSCQQTPKCSQTIYGELAFRAIWRSMNLVLSISLWMGETFLVSFCVAFRLSVSFELFLISLNQLIHNVINSYIQSCDLILIITLDFRFLVEFNSCIIISKRFLGLIELHSLHTLPPAFLFSPTLKPRGIYCF